MAHASKDTTGSAAAATAEEQLLELLSLSSDVQLLFDEEVVPAQSNILSMWSKVLSNALEASHRSSSTSSTSSSARLPSKNSKAAAASSTISIPMDGTSKDDWLTALSFIYPVVPPPVVAWDNLEVLFTISTKYDMPALLGRAATFLRENAAALNGMRGSVLYAWQWITLADEAGLADVAQVCITACVEDTAVVAHCNKQLLASLSPTTCRHVAEALARRITPEAVNRCSPWISRGRRSAGGFR